MAKEIGIRIFIGEKPLHELTQEEYEDFQRRTAERIGNTLNDYFSAHIEEYQKI